MKIGLQPAWILTFCSVLSRRGSRVRAPSTPPSFSGMASKDAPIKRCSTFQIWNTNEKRHANSVLFLSVSCSSHRFRHVLTTSLIRLAHHLLQGVHRCIDPLKSCSGHTIGEISHEYDDGRRHQEVDGQAQSGVGHGDHSRQDLDFRG